MEKRSSTQQSILNSRLVHRRQEFELVTLAGPFAYFFPLLFKYVVPMGHPPTGETDPQGQGSVYRVRLTRGPSINSEYDTTVLLFP